MVLAFAADGRVRPLAKIKQPSAAVLAARARRGQQAADRSARIQWFIDEVSDKVEMTMDQRIKLSTQFLKAKIVRNISKAVVRAQGRNRLGQFTRKRVRGRSKPGEFPRADTTQLMKTIFDDYTKDGDHITGYVGTPLDYGLILETKRDRSFLKRTLDEELPTIKRILTGPIK